MGHKVQVGPAKARAYRALAEAEGSAGVLKKRKKKAAPRKKAASRRPRESEAIHEGEASPAAAQGGPHRSPRR